MYVLRSPFRSTLPALVASLLLAAGLTAPATSSAAAELASHDSLTPTDGGGICNRTRQIQKNLLLRLDLGNCAAVNKQHLAGITGGMNLISTDIRSLKPGDFKGLSNLESLYLNNNPLQTLPQGIFSPLTSLTLLQLTRTRITSFPVDVFDPLRKLQYLYLDEMRYRSLPPNLFDALSQLKWLVLNNSSLTQLPPQLFKGLSSLTHVWAEGNSGTPFGLRVDLLTDADGKARVRVAEAAPQTLNLPLYLSERPTQRVGSVSIQAGDTLSAAALVTLPSGLTSAQIKLANLPSLNGSGMQLLADTESVTVSNDGSTTGTPASGGICDRTPQVRDALVAALSANDCHSVTHRQLATLTESLDLSNQAIASLRADDFLGLHRLRTLKLNHNYLGTLPARAFVDLSSLSQLHLHNNVITRIDANAFESLTALRELNLQNNHLVELQAPIFRTAPALRTLRLDGNYLIRLPSDLFAGSSKLRQLHLQNNQLASLPDGIFAGLSKLRQLHLGGNGMRSLSDDLLQGNVDLRKFIAPNNPLNSLPDGIFAGLSKLNTVDLQSRAFAHLALRVEVVQEGGRARVKMPHGAPQTLRFPLVVHDGRITPSSVTIEAGQTESSPTQVTRTTGDPRVELESLPALTAFSSSPPNGYRGIYLTSERTTWPTSLALVGEQRILREGYYASAVATGYSVVVEPVAPADGHTPIYQLSGDARFQIRGNSIYVVAGSRFDYASDRNISLTVTSTGYSHRNNSLTVPIVISDTNQPPVLQPLSDRIVSPSEVVALQAVVTDDDGDNLVYQWTTTDSRVTFEFESADPGRAWVRIPPLEEFTYEEKMFSSKTIEMVLTVSDGDLIASDSLNLMVQLTSTPNRAPVLTPLTDLFVAPGALVDYLAQAEDPDGDNLLFSWHISDSRFKLEDERQATLKVRVPPLSDFTAAERAQGVKNVRLTLTASDGNLQVSDWARLQVYLAAPSSQVVVRSFSVLNPDAVHAGDNISLSARVTNMGTTASAATSLSYHLSSDASISTEDSRLALARIPALETQASHELTSTMRNAATPGAWYYGACVADPQEVSGGTAHCSAGVAITVLPDLASAGICGRTPRVRDALVAKIAAKLDDVQHCSQVTQAHLAGIASDLRVSGLTTLKSGDFDGLSSLHSLHLNNGTLVTLPTDIFSGLSGLRELSLADNSLLHLMNTELFEGLSQLQILDLAYNRLQRLPYNLLHGLRDLRSLTLNHNLLDELPPSLLHSLHKLRHLRINDNHLLSLPAEFFAGSGPGLQVLEAHQNRVSPLLLHLSLKRLESEGLSDPTPATLYATIKQGAPKALQIPMTISYADGPVIPTTIEFAAGATHSKPLLVGANGQSSSVTVAYGTLPAFPDTYSGVQFIILGAMSLAMPITPLTPPAVPVVSVSGTQVTLNEGTYATATDTGYRVTASNPNGGDATVSLLSGDSRFFLDGDTIEVMANSTFDYETKHSFDLVAIARDKDDIALTDTVSLTVNIGNLAPTANAGTDQTDLTPGATATLDGSASSDVAGGTLTYSWTAPAGITLSSLTAAKPTFTLPADAARLTFSLVVNDGTVDSTADTVVVNVLDSKPSFGSSTAIADQAYIKGKAASLTLPQATGGNGTLTYSLTGTLPRGLEFDASSRTLSGTPEQVVVSTSLTYSVSDSDNDSASLDFSVSVRSPTAPTITVSGTQATLNEGTYATATDTGYRLATSSESDTAPTLSLSGDNRFELSGNRVQVVAGSTFDYETASSFALTAKATDGSNSSINSTASITVSIGNLAPTANAGADQPDLTPGATATLDGSASSDIAGGTLTYQWTAPAGITLSDSTAAKPTFTLPVDAARLTFSLVVNDGTVDSSTDTVVVNVLDSKPSFGSSTVADHTYIKGKAASLTLPQATGGNGTLTYSLTGTLPRGLEFDASSRTLSGTPEQVVVSTSLTYSVSDSDNDSASLGFNVHVRSPTAPTITVSGTQATLNEGTYATATDTGYRLATSSESDTAPTLSLSGDNRFELSGNRVQVVAGSTFDYETASSFALTAKARDAKDNSIKATAGITVSITNLPPTANAGPNQTGLKPGATASLDGSASFDPAGGSLTYRWSSDDDYSVDNPIGAKTTVSLPSDTAVLIFSLVVSDGAASSIADTVVLSVTDATPSFGSSTVADQSLTLDTAASLTLPQATGGDGSLTYRLAGTLPAGLGFDADTRVLSGTPTAPATATLTYSATDSDGDSAELSFKLTVSGPELKAPRLSVTGSQRPLNEGTYADATDTGFVVAATASNPKHDEIKLTLAGDARFALNSGKIRVVAGSTFDYETQSSFPLTVRALNAAGSNLSVSVIVNARITNLPPTANAGPDQSGLRPNATATLDGSASADPAGGSLTFRWTAPPGITLSDSTAAKPTLTLPSNPRDLTFSLTVNDGALTGPADRVVLSVTNAVPSFGAHSLDDQQYLQLRPHSLQLPAATGGDGSLTYSLAGTLPPGMDFNASTRTLSGTPTQPAAATSLTYSASDSDGDKASLTFSLSVLANSVPSLAAIEHIEHPPQSVLLRLLPAATGGDGKLTYSLTGLPSGLAFSTSLRSINGRTGKVGILRLTYTATDANGDTATQRFRLVITNDLRPRFGEPTATISHPAQSLVVRVLPKATGGNGQLTYNLTGLTPGLTFNASLRMLSGRTGKVGTRNLTYTATDEDGDVATQRLTLSMTPDKKPSFGQGSQVQDRQFFQNTPVRITLPSATGGDGSLTHSLAGAPTGLTFDAGERTLSGEATGHGVHSLTYSAADSDGDTVSQSFRIKVFHSVCKRPNSILAVLLKATKKVSCDDLTPGDLAGVIHLDLSNAGLGSLRSSYFSGLVNLRSLDLSGNNLNGLAELPSGPGGGGGGPSLANVPSGPAGSALAGLDSLQSLDLSGNNLGKLGADSFAGLDSLRSLDLSGNQLNEVPEGTFEGLSNLQSLDLSGDESIDFALTLTRTDAPEDAAGPARVSLSIAQGAPATLKVPLLLQGNAVAPASVTLPAGATEVSFGVTQPPNAAGRVTVTLGELPPLPAAYKGFTLTAGEPLTLFSDVRALAQLPPLQLHVGDRASEVDLAQYFTNLDSDTDLRASSRDSAVVRAAISGAATLLLTPVGVGQTTVSVQADSATLSATVVVSQRDLSSHREILARHGLTLAASAEAAIAGRLDQISSGMRGTGNFSADGTAFEIPLQTSTQDTASEFKQGLGGRSGGLAIWGVSDRHSLAGSGDLNWRGDIDNTHFGIDGQLSGSLVGGVLMMRSTGSFSLDTDDFAGGEYSNDLTSVHPYLAWTGDSGLQLWMGLGAGSGSIGIVEDGEFLGSGDASLDTMQLGISGPLLSGGTKLDFKGELLTATLSMAGNSNFAGMAGSATRLRAALQSSWSHRFSSGATLEPSLTVGMRSDSGDVEVGGGTELGGGLRFTSAAGNLTLETGFRTLQASGDYEESGFSFRFEYAARKDGRGLFLSVEPSEGEADGDATASLWNGKGDSLAQVASGAGERRMEAEVSYGLASGVGVWQPYTGVSVAEGGSQQVEMGTRLALSSNFDLDLGGEMGEDSAGDSEQKVRLGGKLRF